MRCALDIHSLLCAMWRANVYSNRMVCSVEREQSASQAAASTPLTDAEPHNITSH